MATTRKSRIFIASSSEGLDIAEAIQYNLRNFNCRITLWSQYFSLTESTLHQLLRAVEVYDFGIFLFSPDDMAKIRTRVHRIPRDNVVFELGLFLGRLGKKRTILIKPSRMKLRLPTDLIGITAAEYEYRRDDETLLSRLGPACFEIKRAIRKAGPKKSVRREASAERQKLMDIEKKLDQIQGSILSISSIPSLKRAPAKSRSPIRLGKLPKSTLVGRRIR